jgi:hypothetical protein
MAKKTKKKSTGRPKAKRSATKRPATKRPKVKRAKSTAARHSTKKRAKKTKKRSAKKTGPRHVVRGHNRKPTRKMRARGRKVIPVKRHLSHEDKPVRRRRRAKKSVETSRPRRRKARRSVAQEVAMALEKHTKKKPRRRRKKARSHSSRESTAMVVHGAPRYVITPKKRGKRGKKRAKRAGSVKGYSYKRGGKTIRVKGRRSTTAKKSTRRKPGRSVTISRTVRGKKRKTAVRVAGRRFKGARKVNLTRKRHGRKRKVAAYVGETRKRRSSKRRSGKRRSSHRRSRSMREFYENPLSFEGGYEKNPLLSGGEIATLFVTAGIGYMVTDALDRYMATDATNDAATNALLIQSAPNLKRWGIQAGVSAGFLALAYAFRSNGYGRAAFQGAGIGAGIHVVSQFARTFVIGKLLGTTKDATSGALSANTTSKSLYQMYPDTINAEVADENAVLAAGTSATPEQILALQKTAANKLYTGLAGLPVGVGAGPSVGVGMMFSPRTGPVMVPINSTTPIRGGTPQPGVYTAGGSYGGDKPQSPPVATGGGGTYQPPTYQPPVVSSGGPVATGPMPGMTPPGMPTPVVGPMPGGCAPCGAETAHAALSSAYGAAMTDTYDQGCLGAPSGFKTRPGRMEIPD